MTIEINMRRVLCLALLPLLGNVCSCRLVRREVLLISQSPNGSTRIEIFAHIHGADESLSMELIKKGRMLSIYGDAVFGDREDRMLGVAEVYWSPDSTLVGVLVCDAPRNVIVGYDSTRERTVPSESVAAPLRNLLTKRYGLTPETLAGFEGDAISWACSRRSDAFERFRGQLDSSRHLPPIL